MEVDKTKVEVIAKLSKSKCIKDIISFLGYAGFYPRFIKEFSKITRPLTNLFAKDAPFNFDDRCLEACEKLKQELVFSPIISAPDWTKLFEIICDALDFAIGVVLGHHINNRQHTIYYASRSLNDVQQNYTTTEKEFLTIVFALENFRLYPLGFKTTVFTDHSALRYLVTNKNTKARLIQWILLL